MPRRKKEHLDFQRSYFDRNVDFFKQPIPDEVIERSREIASNIVANSSVRILDVGTGIGAFLKYYHECGVDYGNILACDLSAGMLAEARKRYPQVNFWQGDVLDLADDSGPFDLAVFNACFGNIIDQKKVLKKVRGLLSESGRIAISHPMGNQFVSELKAREPELVITLMPDKTTLEGWANELSMKLAIYRDEDCLYLALLECS